MGNFFGSLLSGASSLVGGLFNNQNQQSINQQNIQNQDFLAGGGETVAMANSLRAAGINPAAATSSFSPPSAVSGVASPALGDAIAKAGSDIGGAATDYMDSKNKALQTQLLQNQVDSSHEDVVAAQLRNSVTARTMASPGKLPSMNSRPKEFQTFDTGITGLSRDASESVMNAASWPLVPLVGGQLLYKNLKNAGNAAWDYVRPDVTRAVNNLSSVDPGSYNTP